MDPEYLSILSEEDKQWSDMSVSNIDDISDEYLQSGQVSKTTGKGGKGSKGPAPKAPAPAGTANSSLQRPFRLLREAVKKKVFIVLRCEYSSFVRFFFIVVDFQ